MRTTEQFLPGICRLWWVDCEQLQPMIEERYAAGVPVAALADIHEILFFGQPTIELEGIRDANERKEQAVFKFKSRQIPPIDVQLGFVVEDAAGRKWLMGTREEPHPAISFTHHSGSPGDEPACWSVEARLSSNHALIEIDDKMR